MGPFVARRGQNTHINCVPIAPPKSDDLVATWSLPYAARLGSSVRSQGLYLEVRVNLPKSLQKALTVKAGELTLRLPANEAASFASSCAIVSKALEGIASRPVIPREIEDILGITTTERRRWLADGRLPSAGTHTVKLRGRGTITFHVFDPRSVQEILDGDLVDAWRADDAEKAEEKRRRAAWKRKLVRSQQPVGEPATAQADDDHTRFKLRGWAEFEREGLLRPSKPQAQD